MQQMSMQTKAGEVRLKVLKRRAQTVARSIARAIIRGGSVLYTPWFWWPIMTIIRAIPERISSGSTVIPSPSVVDL
jgi:hypothetical protein